VPRSSTVQVAVDPRCYAIFSYELGAGLAIMRTTDSFANPLGSLKAIGAAPIFSDLEVGIRSNQCASRDGEPREIGSSGGLIERGCADDFGMQ